MFCSVLISYGFLSFLFMLVNCLIVFTIWLQVQKRSQHHHRVKISVQIIWLTTRGISRMVKKIIDLPFSFLKTTSQPWRNSVNLLATVKIINQFTTQLTMWKQQQQHQPQHLRMAASCQPANLEHYRFRNIIRNISKQAFDFQKRIAIFYSFRYIRKRINFSFQTLIYPFLVFFFSFLLDLVIR